MKLHQYFCVALAGVFLSACQTAGPVVSLNKGEATETIPFSTNRDIRVKAIKAREGTLIFPISDKKKLPAVVMVHGTAGPDARYSFHTRKLLDRGIAVFQTDFKTGIYSNAGNRPKGLGRSILPLAADILKRLRKHPRIEPTKIGLMGYSLGGYVTMKAFPASFRNYMKNLGDLEGADGFAAHVAYYPQCKNGFNDFDLAKWAKKDEVRKVFAGGPMLVIAGTEDSYGDGKDCPIYVKKPKAYKSDHLTLMMMEGAHHGFDGQVTASFFDPYAIDGQGYAAPHYEAAKIAGKASADFMDKHLN